MLKLLKVITIPIALMVMAVLPFRNLINNLYVGEPFDTRLMIVVHEHWFWVFKGLREYDDLRIFYPFQNTLGFTDGFLIDGFIYSIIRSLKFSMIQSYNLTNIIILFLSNIGLYLILKEIIRKKYLVLALIYLISNGYILIAYLHLWPNTLGYLLISWPIYFMVKIYQKDRSTLFTNILFVFMPLYALSFWYPTFFLISALIIIGLINLIFKNLQKSYLTRMQAVIKSVNYKIFLLVSPLWIVSWLIFFQIYIKNLLNIRRDTAEILYGPTIRDLFSTKLLGGSYFQPIYEFLNFDQGKEVDYKFTDWLIGFSPFMLFIFLLIIFLKKKSLLDKYLIFGSLYIFIVFTNFNGYGIFIYLYNQFEILRVIRVPSRFNLYIAIFMLILIFRYLDSRIIKQNKKSHFLLLIPIVLIIDNFRIAPGRWSEEDFININLLTQKSKIISNCEYFSVTNPGAGHWSDTMDGMVLSAITNVPTLNGYSGTSPGDGIRRLWTDPSEVEEVKNYVKRQKLENNGCIVSNDGVTKIDSLLPNNVLIQSGDSSWEQDKESYWSWLVRPKNNLKITVDELLDPDFQFIIESPPCLLGKYSLTISNNNQFKNYDLEANSKIYFSNKELKEQNKEYELILNSNFKGCYVGSDPRQLFYKIVLPRV